jgi:hypothetical protein
MISSYAETTTTTDYELSSSPQPTSSTSSTLLSQEPWNKVQSSYAAKRKKMQAERMRQLKELEEQVTETANWNQRRKELVTTSSRRTLTTDDSTIYPTTYPSNSSSSSSHSPVVRNRQTCPKIDLGDATLEDLEDLIAASAKRLASYRLRNQKLDNTDTQDNTKKSDDMERWKGLLESSSSTNLSRLSNTKHYDADPIANDNSFVTAVTSISPTSASSSSTTMPSGEKSPSASYLRLRNMFEPKDSENNSRKASFSLADLANPPLSHTRSKKKDDLSSTITTTRSTLSSATPKIESPRFSASTTPRSVHLRKATRRVVSPSASSSSLVESSAPKKTESITRSRKLSTLASLQQRQRQQHLNKEETASEDEHKSVDDYMNSIKKTSSTTSNHRHRLEKSIEEEPITKRKVKLSINTSNITVSVLRKPKESTAAAAATTTATTTTAIKGPVIIRRKRGKVKDML